MKKLPETIEAYLDIETTGLYPRYNKITVVGIYLINGIDAQFIQLVGEDITAANMLDSLQGVDVIYTYNGSRFDLPFIYTLLGIDSAKIFTHRDLMYDCWRNNLYAGFKLIQKMSY